MFNWFKRGQRKTSYPIIKYGFRGENIEYKTETDSLEILFSYIGGKRLQVDFTKWRSGSVMSDLDKEEIIKNCLKFCNKHSLSKTIVIINTDVDKDFWISTCNKYHTEIKKIEYTSKEKMRNFMVENFMQTVRRFGKVTINDKDYFSEPEIIKFLEENEKST